MTTVPAAVALALLPEGYVAGAQKKVAADQGMTTSADKVNERLRDAKGRFTGAGTEAKKFGEELVRAGANGRKMAEEIARSNARAASSMGGLRSAIHLVQASLAAIGLRALIDSSIEVVTQTERIGRTFTVTLGSVAAAKQEYAFVRAEAARLGLVFGTTADAYAKFVAAASGSLPLQQIRDVFVSVTEAMANLGLGAFQQERALLALQQIASKGTVSMEELRQQLGESLPGALQLAAQSMGKTVAQFSKMVENGEVLAKDLLPKFAIEVRKAFGTGGTEIDNTVARINRFKNAVTDLRREFGEGLLSGFLGGLANLQEELTGAQVQAAARDFGRTVGDALRQISGAVVALVRHLDQLKGALIFLVTIKFGTTVLLWAGNLRAMAAAGELAKISILGLNAAMLATPFGAVLVALAAVAAGLGILSANLRSNSVEFLNSIAAEQEQNAVLRKLQGSYIIAANGAIALRKEVELLSQAEIDNARALTLKNKILAEDLAQQAAAKYRDASGAKDSLVFDAAYAEGQRLENQSKMLDFQARRAEQALDLEQEALDRVAKAGATAGEDISKGQQKAIESVQKMIRELERSLVAKKAELAATIAGDETAQRSAERAAAVAKAVADAEERLANSKLEIDPKVREILTGLAGSLVDVGFAIDDAKVRQDGLNATWKESVEGLRDLRASLRDGLILTSEEAAGIVASLETQVRTLSQSLRIAGEGTQAHGKITRELAAAQALLATALGRTVAIQAQAERAGRAAIESQSRSLADQIAKIKVQTTVLGLSSDAARRWHDEQEAMAEAARIASATIEHVAGETAGEYARRWLEAARAAKAAIEEQAGAEYAKRIKEYVLAPLKQAAAQTRDSFLDAFAAWIGGAKISVKELIQSWLQLWIRAFAEWLARWTAIQIKAAAIERARKLGTGGSTGGGGVDAGTVVGAGKLASGAGVSANTLAGAALAAYALYVVYLAFIKDNTKKFAEVTLAGGSRGNDASSALKIRQALNALSKAAIESAKQLQLGLTELGNITVGQYDGNFYVKDPGATIESIGRGFSSVEEALEYAQVRAIQLGQVSDQVGALVQSALKNSRAVTLEGLGSDIDFARLLQNAGLDASLAELQSKLQTFISDFADNWKRAIELFGSDLPALAQALAGVGGILINAFQAERDLLTGKERTQAEELQLAQARAKIWNATKAVQEAQIALQILELKVRIANAQAARAALGGFENPGRDGRVNQGPGTGTTGPAVSGILAFSSAMVQTGIVAVTTASVMTGAATTQLDALNAQLAALEALARALAEIPVIDLGDVVVPGGGGNRGGGGGDSKADDKKFLVDFFKQIALSKMRDVGRALADINARYAEARDRANGDAAAIARLNEERQREINLLKRDLARRTGEFFGRGGELGSSLRSVNDQVQDLINSYRDLHDAGELTTAELHRMVQALINAAQAQRQAIVQGAYSDLLLSLLDATGKTNEAAIERWKLAVLEYQIKLAELKFAIQQYNLIGFNVAMLEGLLAEFIAAGPPAAAGPPPPANDNIQDLYRQRLAEQAQLAAQLRDEAARLLRSYQTQALNPLQQALARLAEDFQKIRAAFGNTAEVQQAYNAALLRIIDEQLRPIQDYLDSINLSEESPLDPRAQLDEAQRQYQAILAAVQGGDYSRIGELTAAAQRLLQAQGAVSPMATQQYRDLFASINAQLLELQRRIREQAAAGILPGGGLGAGNGTGRGGSILPPGTGGGAGGQSGSGGGSGGVTSGDPVIAAIERGTTLTLPYFVRISRGAEETAANTNRIARQLEGGYQPLPS